MDEFSIDLDSIHNLNIADNKQLNNNNYNNNNNNNKITNNWSKTRSSNEVKQVKTFGLNLSNLPRQDFNDEFMANYSEFSPSWRKEADKMTKSTYYLI